MTDSFSSIGNGSEIDVLLAGTSSVTNEKSSALTGLYSGLRDAKNFYSLVVGCDMPFLNPVLLNYMASQSSGFDVVIPEIRGLIEPLHAIYCKTCLPTIGKLLKVQEYSLRALLPRLTVKNIPEGDINRFDPKQLSFYNINTEADLQRAELLLDEEGKVL